MRIYKEDNESVPVPIQDFLITGEYDQGDVALVSYDALYDFIQSEIDLERKRIVEEIKTTDFWKACEDYFTPEQREYFINSIHEVNKAKYVLIDKVPKWQYSDGSIDVYKHQDEDFSKICGFQYCRCQD